jgi:hypothetical protein
MSNVLKPDLIVNPKSGDIHRAEDIIGELSQVLRKYGYGLLFDKHKGVMVLAQITEGMPGFAPNARVIAMVDRILPGGAVYHEVDWTPGKITKQ